MEAFTDEMSEKELSVLNNPLERNITLLELRWITSFKGKIRGCDALRG